jgi:hypothetical protein
MQLHWEHGFIPLHFSLEIFFHSHFILVSQFVNYYSPGGIL